MEPWIQLFTGQLLLYKENADVFGRRRSGKLVRKLKKGSRVGLSDAGNVDKQAIRSVKGCLTG